MTRTVPKAEPVQAVLSPRALRWLLDVAHRECKLLAGSSRRDLALSLAAGRLRGANAHVIASAAACGADMALYREELEAFLAFGVLAERFLARYDERQHAKRARERVAS